MPAVAGSLLVCVLLALSAPAAAQAVTFARTDYAAAPGARTLVTADFDRDGWPDIAEAGLGSTALSLLLNARGHGFTAVPPIPIGVGAFAMSTGDFNRDAVPDLVVANADSNSLSVLLGRGDGRFTRTDIGTRASPRGITTGDFNQDGCPDLAYTAYIDGTVEVLLGDGTGAVIGRLALGYAAQPQGIGTADINHDGHADLVVAHNAPEGLIIWEGRAGGYRATVVPGASYLNVLAIADLNTDGWVDLAAASTDRGRVAIYLGSASGLVFRASYIVDGDPRGITIADVTNDGVLDVITANRATSTVTVLPGDPAHRGWFGARLTFAAGLNSRAVAAGDLNGDGRVDLVTANQYQAAVSLLANVTPLRRAAYTFARVTVPLAAEVSRYREGLSAGAGVGVADFNRDGKLDAVKHVVGSDSVAVILRDGDTITLSGPHRYAGHVVDDFNDDGNADVVYFASAESRSGTRLIAYLGNGRGGFTSSPATNADELSLTACVAGDLHRNRRLDLVCVEDRYRGGALFVLNGNGDGTFRPQSQTGGRGMDPQVADVNRDGRLDVVLGDSGQIWLGDGNGGLTQGDGIDIGVNTGWRIRLVDVNRDGYLDLISSYNGESIYATPGGPNGFRGPSGPSLVNCECDFSFEIADVDVDGNPDILVNSVDGTELAGMLFVLKGNGDGTFGSPEAPFNGADVFAMTPGEMAIVDVTGDGLPDIVVPGARQIEVLVNQRSETNRPPIITNYSVDRTIDYLTWRNKDGCVDFPVGASDPDQHAVSIAWQIRPEALPAWTFPRDRLGSLTSATTCIEQPGRYEYELTASDERGGTATRVVAIITVLGPE